MQEIKQNSSIKEHDYIVLIKQGTHYLDMYPKDTVFKVLRVGLGSVSVLQDRAGKCLDSASLTTSGGIPRFRFAYKNEVRNGVSNQ